MVSNAKESIAMTYYIYQDDIFGKAFLGLLRKKIEEGVHVTFMIDARGSTKYKRSFLSFFGKKDYLQELLNTDKTGKSRVVIYNPLFKQLLQLPSKRDISNLVASNHDKIIIVDNRYLMTGGRNIAKEYFTEYQETNKNIFTDSDIYIDDGPNYSPFQKSLTNSMLNALIKEIEMSENLYLKKDRFGNIISHKKELEFYRIVMNKWLNGEDIVTWWKYTYPQDSIVYHPADDRNNNQHNMQEKYRIDFITELASFKYGTKHNLNGEVINYNNFNPQNESYNVSAKILDKGSLFFDDNDLTESLISLIDASTSEIIIQNPYVIITPCMEEALLRASDRGVKIILHTASPITTDVLITQIFFIKKWSELLQKMKNLEIWVSTDEKRKIHSKLFVFDNEVTVIGTYNLDPLSENINSEIAVSVRSPELAANTREKIMHPGHGDLSKSKQLKIEYIDGKVKELFSPEDTIKDINLLKKIERLKKSPLLKLIENYV